MERADKIVKPSLQHTRMKHIHLGLRVPKPLGSAQYQIKDKHGGYDNIRIWLCRRAAPGREAENRIPNPLQFRLANARRAPVWFNKRPDHRSRSIALLGLWFVGCVC